MIDKTETGVTGQFLEIAVPGPLRRTFQYRLPAGADPCLPGARLAITFNNRRRTGILIHTTDQPDIAPERIKAVTAVIDPQPVLPPTLIRLCERAADYYHHGIGDVFVTALPKLILNGEPTHAGYRVLTAATPPADGFGRAAKQAALYQRLEAEGPLPAAAIGDFGNGVIRALVERGAAAWIERPAVPFSADELAVRDPALVLSAHQQRAIDAIGESGESGTHLLFGVTGSGKTEVYLRLIERCLRAGRQALVLVPEIGLTPQTLRRFSERFNVPVVALHSGLTDHERLAAWQLAMSGTAGVIIGTRSAVFTPLHRPGIIIVDEEHDGSYKQNDGFRYSARDLAVWRGNLETVPVVLGSATPSLESLHNADAGKYALHTLPERSGDATPEQYEIINTEHEPGNEPLARRTREAILAELARGNQVLVFINRRGYAPVLHCRTCAWIAACPACDARLTVHKSRHRMACHHCGFERRVYQQCGSCGGLDLVLLGEGTQRLEEYLEALTGEYPILRIDRDSTRRKGAMAQYLDIIRQGDPAVLIGTQLLAKGHHFPNVTLVVMLDVDAGFFSADFRADEKTGQLIRQVGGRAGRADKPGRVILESGIASDARLTALTGAGYEVFARGLLDERRRHALPPLTCHCLVRADSPDAEAAMDFLSRLQASLPPVNGTECLGPISPVMEKRAGRFRSQLLLAAGRRGPLHQLIRLAIEHLGKLKAPRNLRWAIDVDPNETW